MHLFRLADWEFGINQKLLFHKLSFINRAPLSTSSDIIIANNFATTEGIVL